jgi:hypothetical protein
MPKMIVVAGSILFLVVCVAVYAFRRKKYFPREENGHDRAERRERHWRQRS